MQSYIKDIENNFSFLTKFGFTISFPQSAEIDATAIFTCPSFKMRLLLYHQELYLEFSKTTSNECIDEDRSWVAFCWLIEYLSGNNNYRTDFFKNEINYDERIKKQIHSISDELKIYISRIMEFFDGKDYEKQFIELRSYIFNRLKNCGLL